MLSKVFNTSLFGLFKAQPITVSNAFAFCTTTGQRQESHPLRNKIMGLSTFDEFNSFFKEKRQQFDVSCYSMASRTLAKILIEAKMLFNYDQREAIKNYLSNLQKVEIDQMNLQQFSQVLYLLRILRLDSQNNTSFISAFVKTILERSEGKLKELEAETNVNRLCYFYQEYSSLGGRQSTAIAKKINQYLKAHNSEVEFQHLTVNEINMILKGMKTRKQISGDEIYLLRAIVKTVVEKYFDQLSFFELAQISVSINEINSINMNDIVPNHLVNQIHKKILTNIDELDEKSIMYILNGQKTGNKTYQSIYKVIFDKILDEIQPNGESSFNELFTLRLFNGMSDKIRLQSTTPENQEKFFAFLKHTLTKTPRFIHNFMENFIQTNFFNMKHMLRVVEILESIPDYNFKLSLMYRLSRKRQNVSKLVKFDMAKDVEVKGDNLIMMISVVENLIPLTKDATLKQQQEQFLAKLKKRFFDLYKVQDDSFSKLIMGLDPELLETLHRHLRVEIEEKFPNPMETEQADKYRAAWLKLQVFGNNETTFSKKYIHLIKEKLTQPDLYKLIRTAQGKRYESTDTVSNLMNLALKRFDLVQGNNDILGELTRLMHQDIKQIFEEGASDSIRSRYWHILNECFEKLEPTKFFGNFVQIISAVLRLSTYEFKYSSQYKSFLMKILSRSQFINNKNLASDVLSECLKLNLIRRSEIPNLSDNLKNNLSENQKMMLKMIEVNEFQLKDMEVTKDNLHFFLYNLSPQTFTYLNSNKEKVQKIISELSIRDTWKCMIHFRLGSKKQESEIMESLFKQMNKFKVNYEEFSPIYICEVLKRNNFEKFNIKLDNIRTFLQNSLEFYAEKGKTHKMSLEDHIELVKSTNEFRVKNEDYVHVLLSYFFHDNNIFKRELYLTAGSLGVTLNNKEINRLIEQNFFVGFHSSFSKCFSIFLLFEKDLPNPGTHLTTLINKYNELKAKEKVPVYQLYYDYLRKAYPEETKNWQPNHLEQADFCRSIESLNSRTINFLREAAEDVDKVKWTENVVSGNNYYYTFRNVTLLFPYDFKSHGTNLMLKKIVSSLVGSEKVLILNRRQSSAKSAINFIQQNYEVFSANELADFMKKVDEKYTENKAEVEEEAEETSEGEKAKN